MEKIYRKFTTNCLNITKKMAIELEQETGKKVFLYSIDEDWTDTMIGNKRCAIRGNDILFQSMTVNTTVKSISEALALFRLVCPECDIDSTGRSIVMIADYIPMQSEQNSKETALEETIKTKQTEGVVMYRSLINELCQQYKKPKPVYNIYKTGQDDIPTFNANVQWASCSGKGLGATKKIAMEKAAKEVFINSKLVRDSWVKDLTVEGVEPNPGPVYGLSFGSVTVESSLPIDHVFAESSPAIGDYYMRSSFVSSITDASEQILMGTLTGMTWKDGTEIRYITAMVQYSNMIAAREGQITVTGPVGMTVSSLSSTSATSNIAYNFGASLTDIAPEVVVDTAVPLPIAQPLWVTEFRPSGNQELPPFGNVTALTTLSNKKKNKMQKDKQIVKIVNKQLDDRIAKLQTTIDEIHHREQSQSGIIASLQRALEEARARTDMMMRLMPTETMMVHGHDELKKKRSLEVVDDNNTMSNDTMMSELDYVHDLTKDGDVENNPGPITSADLYVATECDIAPLLDEFGRNPFEQMMAERQEHSSRRSSRRQNMNTLASTIVNAPIIFPGSTEQSSEQVYASIEQYHAHVLHKAKMGGKIGEYFKVLALSLGLDPENKFTLLTTTDFDGDDEPTEDEVDSMVKGNSIKPKKRRDEIFTSEINKRSNNKTPVESTTPKKSKEALLQQRKNVIDRIVGKIKKSMKKIIAWLTKPMTMKFKREVLCCLFGSQSWEDMQQMDQYMYWAYCDVNRVSSSERSETLAEFDDDFAKYAHCFKTDNGAEEADAKLHNKSVHAYNGNPMSQSFSDVTELPSWRRILEDTNDVLPIQMGMELQNIITNVDGGTNPNLSSLAFQDRLRGNVVNAANAIVQNAIVAIPNTNLIPSTVYPAVAGPAIDRTARLPISVVNVSEYYSNPISATQLSKEMSIAVANNQTSNWRRDNTSLAGFSMFDCFSQNSVVTPKGLSLESMLLKIDLLHSTLSNIQKEVYIPNSVYQAFDSRAIVAAGAAELGFNDAPILDEQSGGNVPVFPFGGGTGTIYFHLTLQSVPINRRDDAIFLPPALLMSSIDAQQAIALFVMSFAEYPFGIYTVGKPMTDAGGANLEEVVFIPTSTLVRVPGQQIIDVILPRRYAEQNPTNIAAANVQAVIRPMTGPDASAALAANFALDINAVGVAPVGYNLTDYLYTWALEFDVTTISTYLAQLAILLGIRDELEAVHEMMVGLTQVFPALVSVGPQADALFTPNSEGSWVCSYGCHGVVSEAPDDFPLANTIRSNYRIFETNIASWNKVVLGLATSPQLLPEGSFAVPAYIANPKNNMWERLLAITFAAAWYVWYHARAIDTISWNTGYTNNECKFIQNTVKFSFCTAADAGAIVPARYSKYVNNAYKFLFDKGMKLAKSSYLDGRSRNITANDRWLPHMAYAPTYDITGTNTFTGMIPSVLIDVWMLVPTRNVPLSMGALPPPAGKDSTKGFNKGLSVHRNATNNLVAPYVDSPVKAAYDLDAGPNISDESRWNERLWFTQPTRQILTYSAVALPAAVTFVPAGAFSHQRLVPVNPGENFPPGVAAANTTNLACCTSDGTRIIPYLLQPNATIPIQACNQATTLAYDAWLLSGISSEPTLQALTGERDIFEASFKSSNFIKDVDTNTGQPTAQTTSQAVDTVLSKLSLEVSPITKDVPQEQTMQGQLA